HALQDAFVGRRILVEDMGDLRAAGGKRTGQACRPDIAVFFPQRSGGEDDEEVDPAVKLDIPESLRTRFVYMHPGLSWRDGRQKRRSRLFLERNDLLREFRVRSLLDDVRDLLLRSRWR